MYEIFELTKVDVFGLKFGPNTSIFVDIYIFINKTRMSIT